MSSRRQFVGTTSAVLAGAALGAGRMQAQRAVPAQAGGDLPPAIKALKSMKDQAKPIAVDERRARLDKARALMKANGMNAMMLTGGTSMEYFAGIRWGVSERLLAAIVPVSGSTFLVTPKFEQERAMEQARNGPLGKDTEVYAWEEDESPHVVIAKGLKARSLATGTLGVEETVRFVFADGAGAALPAMQLKSATMITAGCRAQKSVHEIALMRLASQVTLKAYEAAWKSLKDGMTQNDFAALVAAAHQQLGFEGSAGVQVGKYSALPHGSATPQTVREGSILLIDGGCRAEGYCSDISRTFVLGKATQRMKDVFEIEHRAQTTAVKTARPGLACEAVDAAARKVIVDGGSGRTTSTSAIAWGTGWEWTGTSGPIWFGGTSCRLRLEWCFRTSRGYTSRASSAFGWKTTC
ncbi:MAG TPA: Xaa-Pro peptidase family protein [Gemmatimonadaceae bacterium]|nr:Xaa-Pro peptidase family protein [Gemmatimonadaceae bacterium]